MITWAGALRPYTAKTQKKESVTDGPTDRQTDGPTKRVVESRSTRLQNAMFALDKLLVPYHTVPIAYLLANTIKPKNAKKMIAFIFN